MLFWHLRASQCHKGLTMGYLTLIRRAPFLVRKAPYFTNVPIRWSRHIPKDFQHSIICQPMELLEETEPTLLLEEDRDTPLASSFSNLLMFSFCYFYLSFCTFVWESWWVWICFVILFFSSLYLVRNNEFLFILIFSNFVLIFHLHIWGSLIYFTNHYNWDNV